VSDCAEMCAVVDFSASAMHRSRRVAWLAGRRRRHDCTLYRSPSCFSLLASHLKNFVEAQGIYLTKGRRRTMGSGAIATMPHDRSIDQHQRGATSHHHNHQGPLPFTPFTHNLFVQSCKCFEGRPWQTMNLLMKNSQK
jgi:hypothetical protein